jgi:putative ABC transport system permease protein
MRAHSVRLYRLLLSLYPREFRRQFGSELEQCFRDELRGAQPSGLRGIWRVWRSTVVDLGRSIPEEHVAARRARRTDHSLALPSLHSSDGTVGTLIQDLRYAVRSLRHSPGFTAVVVLSLALGIGANTLIYSLVDGVVLHPFPYPDPDRLVAIGPAFPKLGGDRQFIESLGAPEYDDIRTNSRTLEHFLAIDLGNRNISGGDRPERVFTAFIWGDPFRTIGFRPALGRAFRREETDAEAPRVAIISHRLWQAHFGGDSAIVGRTIQVNGTPTTVVGVMPTGLLIIGADLWLPMGVAPAAIPRQARQYAVLARMKPGVSLTQVNADLAAVARTVELAHVNEREEYAGWSLAAQPWANALLSRFRAAGWIVLGAVGLVLLIACANIASIMLARAASRQREVAIRRALGAGGSRIARQLLTESMLLAVVGAAIGVALAWGLMAPTTKLFPAMVSNVGLTATLNGRVLVFCVVVAVASGLIFGLAPALQLARTQSRGWLVSDSARLTTSAIGRRVRQAFTVGEIALALMLLAGAGVLMRGFARLQRVDPGFDSTRLLTMRLSLPTNKYPREAVAGFFESLSTRLTSVPGVQSAAAATQFPPGNVFTARIEIEGQAVPAGELRSVDVTNATAGFFRTLGYTLVGGRVFTDRDDERAPNVAVINETVARRLFPGTNAVGKRIKLGEGDGRDWIEIVGVTRDVRNRGLDAPPASEVFIPVRQQRAAFNNQLFLLVRTAGEPLALMTAIRRTIATLDPDQPVYSIQTLDQAFSEAVSQRRAAAVLVAVFAAVALSMAAVGIYGIMSYAVNERTHEIGIRMALGAQQRDVLVMVVRESMVLVAIGTAVGLAGALALGGAMAGLAYEVPPRDPATLAAMTLTLGAVGLLAALIPARRATRVTPLVALRE